MTTLTPPQTSRALRRVAALAVVALTVSACGSTVRVAGPEIAGAEPAVAAAAPTDAPTAVATDAAAVDTAPEEVVAAPGAAATSAPVVTGGSTAATGDDASTTTEPTTTSGGAAAPAAGAQDTTPVKLGAIILKNGDKIVASMGTEVSFGDGELQVKAVVAALNASGGIGGRPVDLYIAEVDVAAANPDVDYNNACLKLTEDDDVFAVLTVINPPESFISCVGNHEKLLLNASFSPGDDALYADYPDWFFSPTLLSLDRSVALMLNQAKAQGYFDELGVKVGVLYYDGDPQPVRVVEGTVEPMLEAFGVDYVTAGVNDASQVGPAQIQFAGARVTLVVFVTPNGIAQLLFMNAAEGQLYRPKYFTTDSDSMRFVSENAPREQAQNIAGVGTLPIANVPVRSYPTTAREEECLAIMRAAGEPDNDRLTNVTATLYCELVWEFAFVGEQVTGPLTYDQWRAAYRSSGTRYEALSTFGVNFSGGRNDGATLYRPYAWDTSCSCLAYTGPAKPVPAP